MITLFIEVQKLTDELGKIGSDIYSETTRFEKLKISLSTLETEKQIILKKKNSVIGKVLGFLSSKIDFEKELELIIDKELNAKEQLKTLDSSLGKLGARKKGTEIKKEKVLRQLEKIQFLLEESYNIDAASKAELQNALVEKKRQLAEERDQNKIYTSLAKEYESYGEDQLKLILSGLIEEKKKLDGYSIESRIESANVIAATIDTFLYRFRDMNLPIHHIFIDEAGYASIVKVLTVFTYKCPITLLGDHKQLPPVCEISKPDIQKDHEKGEIFVWDQSAIFIGDFWVASGLKDALNIYLNSLNPSFNNLKRWSLTQSYRFGPNLAAVLDKFVYDTGFRSMKKEDTEALIFNVSNPAKARDKGRANQAEAYAIKEFVQKSFSGNQEVAILAPYRAQVKMIQNLIPEFKDENKILTVHKSQGREWDTVIYSVCDIGNGSRPWFTDTQSKISNGLNNVNTAVSRAKKQLILFCCIDEWQDLENQLISGIIKARTRKVEIDSSGYQYKSNSSYMRHPVKKQSEWSSSKTKAPVNNNSNETWESPTLYWSKVKKPGYEYSSKKQAWWKRK